MVGKDEKRTTAQERGDWQQYPTGGRHDRRGVLQKAPTTAQ